jgi:hypothetical protein
MKTLVAAAALAAVIASPAFAQTARYHRADSGQSASAPWDAVIEDNQVVGQDPDANVRLELRRDYESINH